MCCYYSICPVCCQITVIPGFSLKLLPFRNAAQKNLGGILPTGKMKRALFIPQKAPERRLRGFPVSKFRQWQGFIFCSGITKFFDGSGLEAPYSKSGHLSIPPAGRLVKHKYHQLCKLFPFLTHPFHTLTSDDIINKMSQKHNKLSFILFP